MNMKKAMFPGSFDPLHEGHIKIIEKAIKLFDELYVVVTFNNEKPNASDIEKRFLNVKEKLANFKDIKIVMNKDMMTGDFARENNINFIIRSARNVTDFQYELELAAGNHSVNTQLETVLIIPDYSDIKYESRLIKQRGNK